MCAMMSATDRQHWWRRNLAAHAKSISDLVAPCTISRSGPCGTYTNRGPGRANKQATNDNKMVVRSITITSPRGVNDQHLTIGLDLANAITPVK